MKITKTVEIPDDLAQYVVKGIMENFPEASHGAVLVCSGWHYDKWSFTFIDGVTNKAYLLNKEDLLKPFALVFTSKWPMACPAAPISANQDDWDNWLCQCDAEAFDAYIQLVCLGEVIYS